MIEWPWTSACTATIALLLASGCTRPEAPELRQIDLAAFSRAPVEAGFVSGNGGAAEVESTLESELAGPNGSPLGTAMPDELVRLDAPSRAPWRAIAPGERMIVDSMVGQVNGQPVFADVFFEPIEDELVALASEQDRLAFEGQARQLVGRELWQQVQNALFLAEAQAGLSPEEKQGLFHWMNQVREVVTAGYGGTEAEAERKLLEKEGKTLEGYLGDIEDRELIRKLLRERVASRVIVSWHDVERLYRQRYALYNPPGRMAVARIVLRRDRDTSQIAEVESRLAAGESLVEIAKSMGQPDDGIWQTLELGPDGPKGITVANPEIQSKLAFLRNQGETVGPFDIGDYTWWLSAASVERAESRSIWEWDVQRELIAEIRAQRLTEEQEHYIATLLDHDIRDDIEAMAQRLMDIAIVRYAPAR